MPWRDHPMRLHKSEDHRGSEDGLQEREERDGLEDEEVPGQRHELQDARRRRLVGKARVADDQEAVRTQGRNRDSKDCIPLLPHMCSTNEG